MNRTQEEDNTLKTKIQEMIESEWNTLKGEDIEEALD